MKQLLAVIFLYFGSICSLPRKWTRQKLLVKESPTVRRKRFGNPNQGQPEWWTGIPDVCSFLAVLPLNQPSAALNADMMHLQCLCLAAENRKTPMWAFQFPTCCRILWQHFWGWYCPTSKGQHTPSCPLSQHRTHSNSTQTTAPNNGATSPCSEEG